MWFEWFGRFGRSWTRFLGFGWEMRDEWIHDRDETVYGLWLSEGGCYDVDVCSTL